MKLRPACSNCSRRGHLSNNCSKRTIDNKVKVIRNVGVNKSKLRRQKNQYRRDITKVLRKTKKFNINEFYQTFKNMSSNIIDQIHQTIMVYKSKDIVLLRDKEVIQWLFHDLSFLKSKKNYSLKQLEDQWGQETLRIRRPDLVLDKQWTNKFGEHICEELFLLQNEVVSKPPKKVNYQPDAEIPNAILEAKVQTYYTEGTAGEKILGTPFKYAEIPSLYGKPLKIVCMGGAEYKCRMNYGNLPGPRCTDEKKSFVDFFKQKQIEYIGATEILLKLIE